MLSGGRGDYDKLIGFLGPHGRGISLAKKDVVCGGGLMAPKVLPGGWFS